MTDWILRGGEVIDGTGRHRWRADVAIAGDRIAAVGSVDRAEGAREIDVSGKIVAPGFIDVHTHDDRALFATPHMAAKASQGVTTVVTGNCGISLAPLLLDQAPPPPLDLLGGLPIRTVCRISFSIGQGPRGTQCCLSRRPFDIAGRYHEFA
jgi:N-acyl-D-amino-acid deacylase